MADAEKGDFYCLKPKKAKSRAILLKNDNFTVGKNDYCDLRLNSVEIEPICAKLIKFKNKQGWCIVNYSSSEGVSTVRVNRIKLKPNIKKGLKEGDIVSFGYLDGDFEFFYKKYKPQKKKQARIADLEAAGLVPSIAGSSQIPDASSFGSQSVLTPFGSQIRFDVTPSTSAAPVPTTSSPGYASYQSPRNLLAPSTQNVSPVAANFSFGSNSVSSQTNASSSCNFGSDATTSTAPASTGYKNTKKTLSSVSKRWNDFRVKNFKNQNVISAKETITINNLKRRLRNFEKTITELLRDKRELESQNTQAVERHRAELREKNNVIAELKSKFEDANSYDELEKLRTGTQQSYNSTPLVNDPQKEISAPISNNDVLQREIYRQKLFCKQKNAEMKVLKKRAENAAEEMTRFKQNCHKLELSKEELFQELCQQKEKEILQLTKRFENTDREISDSISAKEKLRELLKRQQSDANSENVELKKSNETLKQMIQESDSRQQKLLVERDAEIICLKTQIVLEETNEKAKIDQLNRIGTLVRYWKQSCEKLQNEKADMTRRIQEMTRQKDLEIDNLKNKAENNDKLVDSIKQQNQMLKEEMTVLANSQQTSQQKDNEIALLKKKTENDAKLINELRQLILTLKKDITLLTNHRQQINLEIDQLKRKSNDDAKLINSIQQQNQSLRKSNASLEISQQKSQQKDSEITQLKSKVENYTQFINSLQQNNEKLRKDNAALTSSQQISQQKHLEITELKTEIEKKTKLIKTLQQNKITLISHLKNKEGNDAKLVESLQQQNQTLKDEISVINNSQQSSQQKDNEIALLKKKTGNDAKLINELRQLNLTLKKDNTLLTDHRQRNNLEIAQLKIKSDNDAKLINSIQQQNKSLTKRNASLEIYQQTSQQKDSEITQLKSKVENYTQIINSLQQNNEKLRKDNATLTSRHQNSQWNDAALLSEIQQKELEIARLKNKVENDAKSLNSLQRENEELRNDVAVLAEFRQISQQKHLKICQLKTQAENDVIEKIELEFVIEKLQSEKAELTESRQKEVENLISSQKQNDEKLSRLEKTNSTLKQDYAKLQRDYNNLFEFRRPMLDQQCEETISKLQNQLKSLHNQLKSLHNQQKLFEEVNNNLANERALSQTRLDEIYQLQSELDQHALKRIKLTCQTCKKFGL